MVNEKIQNVLSRLEKDIDYENSAGMLTITCEANGSQIILSRQPAIGEIWLAARSGGFHFRLQETERAGDAERMWCNTQSGEPLSSMLSEACLAQSGEKISFDF